jgi:DNA-3-methyladenine glycosylase II
MRKLAANGPFSLEQALGYLAGFVPAALGPMDKSYRAAHVIAERPVLVEVSQETGGDLTLDLLGDEIDADDWTAAEKLVRRLFSLDWDGSVFYGRIGNDDPVLHEQQERFFGLRPVLFPSPWEALCWAILSQRVNLTQASNLRAKLAAVGPTIEVDGREYSAFPSPQMLLEAEASGLLSQVVMTLGKMGRILNLAERGARGELDADRLLALGPEGAAASLRASPGIGPWATEFGLIRGIGFPDILPLLDRRTRQAIRYFYDFDHEPTDREIERVAEAWSGYRSWAVFLLRVGWQENQREKEEAERGLRSGRPR